MASRSAGNQHREASRTSHKLDYCTTITPAAAPFFGATHDDPMGLSSRRRYRWGRDGDDFRVVDYWDEVSAPDGIDRTAALVESGVDLICVDTAHGHSRGVVNGA